MKTLRLIIQTLTSIASIALVGDALAQNLVTNPGFESGNIGFTTDYTLWPGGPGIGPDRYLVTTDPHSLAAVWNAPGDHTTGSGRMLVVDGSTTAGRVFWRQTVSVATNTTYIFSAWALKMETQPQPILYFTVNGTQQGTFYVLPVTPSGWEGFGVTWSSGSSNTARLELRLQSTSGFGNNLAVDDIAFLCVSDVLPTRVAIESGVQVGWASYPGARYQVEWASTLDTNTWSSLGLPVLGTGTTNYVCDPFGDRAQRFYRLIRLD